MKSMRRSFKNKRVLDLGCNAGLYSVMAAIEGASVVGVERKGRYYKQSLFIKEFFENKTKKSLDINFIYKNIVDIDFSSIGKFDYVFVMAVIYHIGKKQYGMLSEGALAEQERVVGDITKITSSIILGSRDGKFKNVEHYNGLFNKFGFINKRSIKKDTGRSGRQVTLYESS